MPALLNTCLDVFFHPFNAHQARGPLFSGHECVSPRRTEIFKYLSKARKSSCYVAASRRTDEGGGLHYAAESSINKPEIDSLIVAIIHQAETGGSLSQAFQKLSTEDWSKVLSNVGKKHWELALAVFGIFRETSAFLKPKRGVQRSEDDSGLPVNILKVYTTMVAVLSRHGRLEEAETILTEVQQLGFGMDLYLYNALLTGYARKGLAEKMLDCMLEMQRFGIQPDHVSYEQLVAAYLNMKNPEVKMALEVLDHMQTNGLKAGYKTHSDLLASCCQRSEVKNADKCFTSMISLGHSPQTKEYYKLMQLHAQNGNHARTEELFQMLKQAGLKANATCYEHMLHAYCKSGYLNQAFSVFREAKQVLKPSLIVYNMLLDACAKAGLHFQAMQLFNEVSGTGLKPNVLTYTAAITALVRNGKCSKAEELYRRMLRLNITPNAHTYTTMIHAYTMKGWIRAGHEVCLAMRNNCILNAVAYSAMLNLYLRGSWYNEAAIVLGEMDSESVEPGLEAYSALIAACGDSSADVLPLVRSLETSRWETCRVIHQMMFSSWYESCESLLEGNLADLPRDLMSFLDRMALSEDAEINLCFYNAVMDGLWRKGLKRRAKSVMLAARTLHPWYKRPKSTEVKLVLDLRGLSIGAAQVAVLDWLTTVVQSPGVTNKQMELVLVAGTGGGNNNSQRQNNEKSWNNNAQRQNNEKSNNTTTTQTGVKKAISATLAELGSPFVETPHGSGRLVASVHDVINWQAMYGISSVLMLLDSSQPYLIQ